MTRLALVAAVLLSSTAAHAGDRYDFSIGGQSVRIEQTRDCYSASCVSVSIPGVYEHGARRDRKPAKKSEPAVVATPAARDAAPAATSNPVPATPAATLEPANGAPTSAVSAPTVADEKPPAQASAGLAAPSVASVQAVASSSEVPVAAPSPSPLGVWLTEENEGKVRIEACGSNLCGYAIDEKTGQNGDKVLVNMKPTGAKWSGRIYDPNGGSTYSSTIALKGTDRLRVQGCAFGGMMCGEQTWTRVN